MTNEDQKMLQSALRHISNSVTNGRSQTNECEITRWLKSKINAPEQTSKNLEEEIKKYFASVDLKEVTFSDIAHHFADWQKQQTINKAYEWLKRCVDVDDEVKMVNGEPEVHSFIQKIRHRTEVANQIIEDFKKFMEN